MVRILLQETTLAVYVVLLLKYHLLKEALTGDSEMCLMARNLNHGGLPAFGTG